MEMIVLGIRCSASYGGDVENFDGQERVVVRCGF